MCTVTFIPIRSGVILSSNRDESPLRPKALLPMIINSDSGRSIYPVDGRHSGTWVGVQQSGCVIILLNGARVAHVHTPPYSRSRGVIVKELIDSENPYLNWNRLNLDNVEPFTLVLWQKPSLFELTWDGTKKIIVRKDPGESHIWSSSTLYDKESKNKRENWFQRWMKKHDEPGLTDVYKLLRDHNDEWDGFVMNRHNLVRTLSISLIEISLRNIYFKYFDVMTGTTALLSLDLKIKHEEVTL